MLKRREPEEKVTTILGSNSTIEGTLNDLHSIQVDGRFNGDLTTEGEIHVGKMGYVSGNLKGKALIIYGRVHGNLEAKEKIEVWDGATVEGDLRTKRLIIYEGAIFRGHSYMDEVVVQTVVEGSRGAFVS